jgi:glutamate-1-semialdehyde 2,1-aminomutase
MLKKGYLASNSVYSSIEHTPDIVNNYFENLEPIFLLIQECENGKDINSLLQGEVSHSGFKRLN